MPFLKIESSPFKLFRLIDFQSSPSLRYLVFPVSSASRFLWQNIALWICHNGQYVTTAVWFARMMIYDQWKCPWYPGTRSPHSYKQRQSPTHTHNSSLFCTPLVDFISSVWISTDTVIVLLIVDSTCPLMLSLHLFKFYATNKRIRPRLFSRSMLSLIRCLCRIVTTFSPCVVDSKVMGMSLWAQYDALERVW